MREEQKRRILEHMTNFYSGNDTMLGYLRKMFLMMTTKKFNELIYWPELIADADKTIITPSTENLFRYESKENGGEEVTEKALLQKFYDSLIQVHPAYDRITDFDINCYLHNLNNNYDLVEFILYHGFIFYMTETRLHEINSEAKKVYISLKPDNYAEAALEFMKFFIKFRLRIDGNDPTKRTSKLDQFKIRINFANDGTVIRLCDAEQYEILKEMFANETKLQKYVGKGNPFTPLDTVNNCQIGHIPNDEGSYNKFIARISLYYIRYCIEKDMEPNIKDFLTYVENNYRKAKTVYESRQYKGEHDYSEEYGPILIKHIQQTIGR